MNSVFFSVDKSSFYPLQLKQVIQVTFLPGANHGKGVGLPVLQSVKAVIKAPTWPSLQ